MVLQWFLFLYEDEINAGVPYTMTAVELMNVIGSDGVNSGHSGVTYSALSTKLTLILFSSGCGSRWS